MSHLKIHCFMFWEHGFDSQTKAVTPTEKRYRKCMKSSITSSDPWCWEDLSIPPWTDPKVLVSCCFYPDVACPDTFQHPWESEAGAKLWHPGVHSLRPRPQFPSLDGWLARNIETITSFSSRWNFSVEFLNWVCVWVRAHRHSRTAKKVIFTRVSVLYWITPYPQLKNMICNWNPN